MKPFRWGIFGTGAISAKFVAGLRFAEGATVSWVASRSAQAGARFAQAHGIARSAAGYEAAAQLGDVDAIYIATPASEHCAHALTCISAGHPVLVEKPLAMTANEARQIAQASIDHAVFAMEAMWTRFLPASLALREKVQQGALGQIRMIRGSFGSSQEPDPASTMFTESLGGGALTHLGPYPLSWGQWLFGTPLSVDATGNLGEGGVIEDASIQIVYPGNVLGSFLVSLRAWAPDDLHVMGTDGSLALQGTIVRPHGLLYTKEAPITQQVAGHDVGLKARLRQNGLVHRVAQHLNRNGRSAPQPLAHFYSGNGYQYEALEVQRCITSGERQSPVMPLEDSVQMAVTTDAIRASITKNQLRVSG